jgi:hypothetical protein
VIDKLATYNASRLAAWSLTLDSKLRIADKIVATPDPLQSSLPRCMNESPTRRTNSMGGIHAGLPGSILDDSARRAEPGVKAGKPLILKSKFILLLILAASTAYAGTVTGTLQGPSGLPIKNGTLSFNLSQAGLIVGTGSVVPVTASCYTSTNGAVVGLPNPTAQVTSSINYGSGSLPGGIYYVETTFYSSGQETLPSPELRIQLTSSGTLTIGPQASFPSNATGMRVYIGTASGAETLQGSTTSSTAQYSQSTPLISGAAPPATNTSICSIAFNDTIIPYSGYSVSLTSSTGNAYPGWPQTWQLNGGSSGTINISAGAPLWNGVVIYPQPIFAQPLNNGPQSISGPLNFTGFNVVNVGALGVGTANPAWPIDVENGLINSSGGYLYNGLATSGQCLVGNGTAIVLGNCNTGTPVFYQTISNGSTFVAQEPVLAFLNNFQVANGGISTGVDLTFTGVTAGSYTNPTVTVDAYGRIGDISNGPTIPVTRDIIITTGICTTTTASYDVCTTGIYSWPSGGFADTNYTVMCTGQNPSGSAITGLFVTNKTASGFQLELQNGTSNGDHAVTLGEVDCHGSHL